MLMPSSLSRQELAGLAESQTVEFKKSLSLTEEGLVALNAMLNADTAKGLVLFGVGPDGATSGIEPGNHDTAQRSMAQRIRAKFDPPLSVNIELVECDGRILLAVRAERSPGVPYHEFDGRAYIREGSSNRLLSIADKQQLARRRRRDLHNGPWRCNCCGSWVGQLVSYEITDTGVRKSFSCECGGEYWPAT